MKWACLFLVFCLDTGIASGQVLRLDAFRLDEKGRIVGGPGLELYFPREFYKLVRKARHHLPLHPTPARGDTLVTVRMPIGLIDWSIDTLYQERPDTLVITFPIRAVARKAADGKDDEEWWLEYAITLRKIRRALAAGTDTITITRRTSAGLLEVMTQLLAQGKAVAVGRQHQAAFAAYTTEVYGERNDLADQLGWSLYLYETDRNQGYVLHYFLGCRTPKFPKSD